MGSENLSDLYFQCQICLESLASPSPHSESSGSEGRRSLPEVDAQEVDVLATLCGHLYHRVCLNKWFESLPGQKRCPVCRTHVPQKGTTPIHPQRPKSTLHPIQEAIEEEEDEEYESMKGTLHQTLVKDHEEILAKYHQIKTEEETKDALILSLKEDNSKKDIEIERLRRIIAETTGQATEPGSKRRKL